MSEKCLTEGDWKSFAKGESLDDAKAASKDSRALHEAVLEALQELRDLEKSNPTEDDRLQMLMALEGMLTKQIAANAKRKDKDGKAIKDTKAVKDQLYKMLSAVDKQRKEVQAAKDKKDKEAAAKGDDDEDDDSPAILTTKMVPLIRQLKKGEVRYPALIGSISKTAAVLISRKSISNAKRKLLNEALDAKGGVKFAKGECYYETGALHFVMEGKISGLVKRVRAALLNQTGLRLKVKLRGEDGAEEDGIEEDDDKAAATATPPDAARLAFAKRLLPLKAEVDKSVARGDARASDLQALLELARKKVQEGDISAGNDALTALEKLLGAKADAGAAAGGAAGAAAGAAPGVAEGDGGASAASRPPAPPGGPASAEQLAYVQRLRRVRDAYDAALKAQHPESTKLRALMGFASEKSGAKNYESALKALDTLEKLLAAVSAEAKTSPGGGDVFSKVRFEQIHIDWNSRKEDVKQRLRTLHAAITEDWDDPVASTAAGKLEKVLARFNEGLGDTLDALRNSTTAAARNQLAGKAGEIADHYLAYLNGDPLVAHVEDNPFDVAVNARETLGGPLNELRRELAKLGAGAPA